MPFAVVGSRDEVEVNGQKVRARLYPWGTVEGRQQICFPLLSKHFHLFSLSCLVRQTTSNSDTKWLSFQWVDDEELSAFDSRIPKLLGLSFCLGNAKAFLTFNDCNMKMGDIVF